MVTFQLTYVVGHGVGEVNQRLEADNLEHAKYQLARILNTDTDYFLVESTDGSTVCIWKTALGCIRVQPASATT
jgi:hypothetical protein